MVLYAGEMSHGAGADLMIAALPTVCEGQRNATFVFAGDGPLKGELESHAWQTGIGERCRFFGDVPSETFASLLLAADFIVIPARTWQDEGLAKMALAAGRPVLTTHQAQIKCVVHGENGLVTYDNPGSMVWGIRELFSNPLNASLRRLQARRRVKDAPSLDTMAIDYQLHYLNLVKRREEASHG
jgi:glycosyltransferase involved in cell wall biosynthesis